MKDKADIKVSLWLRIILQSLYRYVKLETKNVKEQENV